MNKDEKATLRKKEIQKRGVLRSWWFRRRVQRQLCDPVKSKSRALWYQQRELRDYRPAERASDWPIQSRGPAFPHWTAVRYWYRFFLWPSISETTELPASARSLLWLNWKQTYKTELSRSSLVFKLASWIILDVLYWPFNWFC